jgi:hypothetical protein
LKNLKRQFGDLDKFLEDNSKQIDAFAKKVGKGLAIAFKSLADTVVFLKDNINGVVTVLSGLLALKVATFFHGVATSIAGMTIAMNGFNLATKRNIIFGSITVFASAMGFLIHKFKEFKNELNEPLPTFEELRKDIAELEKRIATSQRGNIQGLKDQLKIKKLQLEELITESGLFHMQNTEHMRNKTLQLGILNAKKEQTKETKKIFNIFESNNDLVLAVRKAEERTLQRIIRQNRNIFEEQNSLIPKIEKELSLREEIFENIKKQNEEFSLSKELTSFINDSVQKMSKAFAETLVLGKKLNMTMRELAQNLLVEIVAKTIERITLKGIEKILNETLFKKEEDKNRKIKEQNSNLKKQIALQLFLNAIGGGGGGGGSGFKFFDKGGAVSKGQPVVVGERGAELFVPNSTGQIQQSARGTGSGAVNVNFTINTIDSRGFNEVLQENRASITGIINSALAEKGRSELI